MRKMNCAKFNFDVFTKTLTISKTFERNAAIYQSTEQKMMKKYMEAYGDALIIRYYKPRNIHQGLTFEQMENYIGYTRETEENLKRFQDVKELSKSQKSPYKYIKDWFLQEYEDATTLTLYCKALALAESGAYEDGIAGLESLGDYKDCAMRITYYIGRYCEDLVNEGNYGQCNVNSWTDIVAIAAGDYHTTGLKADGTVVAVGSNKYGQCDVGSWTDIVALASGGNHTIGLKADGTVVAVGENDYGQCDVDSWTDIVAIVAGQYNTIGLKADGTVIAIKDNTYGQCDVGSWTDIVAIASGTFYTVGLKADGTVVAAGVNDLNQGDVSDWKLW